MNQGNQIGVIGLSVMGGNLALNISNCGYSVSVFNRSKEKTKILIEKNPNLKIFPYYKIKDFIFSLSSPRKILLMIQAGIATDEIINLIIPYLNEGDILIDGGNSFYKDTNRRCNELSKLGIRFIGAGISGGEEGALKGPAIMPSGNKSAYNILSEIFNKIAANYDGDPCVKYIGPNGSGHYVKMVHNGIEYSDMQLIAEAYFLLKNVVGMNNKDLSNVFSEWNKGELNSYLIEITKNILITKDSDGKYLIDFISDQAENKGTGTWTSQSALELNEPLSLITESVFFRYISSIKFQRMIASKILLGPNKTSSLKNKSIFIENVRRALYLGKIISYAQGFSQLKNASEKYLWNLKFDDIAKIFRSGCIIRAKFLNRIIDSYRSNKKIFNLLLTPYFQKIANKYQQSLREIVSFSILEGIPIPTFSSAISYYDSYRSQLLPTNLIQAQRDYFGAHTYRRIDIEGVQHTKWNS
ncbi:6-phosphogluconate dehydrogenase, decarboxylating [Buchnera aphidicola (Tetraneura ulmi)]|uniref:NADP-dependent phosphogluconate dehydrogenase n=1 Tax=Buchnera aphidicola TaxID=9 RepID=UPI003464B7A9